MKRTRPVIALIVALGVTVVASLGSVRVLAQECGAQLGEAEKLAAIVLSTCDRIGRARELLDWIRHNGPRWKGMQERISTQWLKDPMRFAGFMPQYDYQPVEAVLRMADQSGVDPTFLTVVMYQEGLDVGVTRRRLKGRTFDEITLDAYNDIGGEAVGHMVGRLKREGYLRADYDGIAYRNDGSVWQNERGEIYKHPFDFTSVEAAAEGIAAYLKYCRDHFERDAAELGIDIDSMTQVERDVWTYIYYNAGPERDERRSGWKRLNQTRGELPKKFRPSALNTINNGRRVGASLTLYREIGLYDCEKELPK